MHELQKPKKTYLKKLVMGFSFVSGKFMIPPEVGRKNMEDGYYKIRFNGSDVF